MSMNSIHHACSGILVANGSSCSRIEMVILVQGPMLNIQ